MEKPVEVSVKNFSLRSIKRRILQIEVWQAEIAENKLIRHGPNQKTEFNGLIKPFANEVYCFDDPFFAKMRSNTLDLTNDTIIGSIRSVNDYLEKYREYILLLSVIAGVRSLELF